MITEHKQVINPVFMYNTLYLKLKTLNMYVRILWCGMAIHLYSLQIFGLKHCRFNIN
jgi:hypothetical protein